MSPQRRIANNRPPVGSGDTRDIMSDGGTVLRNYQISDANNQEPIKIDQTSIFNA
jgi:hypothetical protein